MNQIKSHNPTQPLLLFILPLEEKMIVSAFFLDYLFKFFQIYLILHFNLTDYTILTCRDLIIEWVILNSTH